MRSSTILAGAYAALGGLGDTALLVADGLVAAQALLAAGRLDGTARA
jgi:hypothetical protein